MWNLKNLSAVQSINRMTWMFKNNCERRISRLWVFFFLLKQTNTKSRSGVFGTKDCMIFLLKKKRRKKLKAPEREKDVSESHWLFIDTYCNQKSSTAAHEVNGGFPVQASAEWDPWHPHDTTRPDSTPSTTTHNPHYPRITCTETLWFYYVQPPCLDYVLFLGFFEVISFSWSDISSGLVVSINTAVWMGFLPRVDANLYSFLFSCSFKNMSSGFFFSSWFKTKCWIL